MTRDPQIMDFSVGFVCGGAVVLLCWVAWVRRL